MTRVGVIGATGYAGAELVRILAGHPRVRLTVLTSRQHHGQTFASIYPALTGMVALTCQPFDAEQVCSQADLFFTALPHKLPMTIVPQLIERGKKVVDLSADFRFKNPATYEAHYQPHTAKAYLPQAVYGLSEIYRDQIRNASLVGNPGCYPTCVLLAVLPLIATDWIEPASLIADVKSGVSGAGRSASLTTHHCEVTESFKAYKVAEHRHNPEMNEVLSHQAGQPVSMTFVPHLLPMSRGMLATVYLQLRESVSLHQIADCFKAAYDPHPFIRLRTDGTLPDTRHVRGTNFCDIGFRLDRPARRLILMSAIDNLVKGAAGQAVQNMNLVLGFEESAGLRSVPYPL